eukprot:scaffold44770_cov214-Amphora_coffeaeformis.AAC.1
MKGATLRVPPQAFRFILCSESLVELLMEQIQMALLFTRKVGLLCKNRSIEYFFSDPRENPTSQRCKRGRFVYREIDPILIMSWSACFP